MKREHLWKLDKEYSDESRIYMDKSTEWYDGYDEYLVKDYMNTANETGTARADITIKKIKDEMLAEDRPELCIRFYNRSRRRSEYEQAYCWSAKEIAEAMVKEFMH